jgi:subtilase family serine protease
MRLRRVHVFSAVPVAAALLIALPAVSRPGQAIVRSQAPAQVSYLSAPAGSASAQPEGYTPAGIRSHYHFDLGDDKHGDPVNGTGQTIGIVIWGSDPHLRANLQAFITRFGLKQMRGLGAKSCAKPAPYGQLPCFEIINTSKTPAPQDYATYKEVSGDVEWAHAIAPGANIIVAQAAVKCKGPNGCGLPGASAVDRAISAVVKAGATVVSMSFEYDSITPAKAATWDGLDATFVSGDGDFGYPQTDYPAADPNVLAVGGTVIEASGPDQAWSGDGGGQTKNARPGYQINWTNSEDFREVSDVSYNALRYSIYDITPAGAGQDWQIGNGVSYAIPQWAGLIADADQVRYADGKSILAGQGVMDGLYLAARDPVAGKIDPAEFTDVTAGCAHANTKSGQPRCVKKAAKGYDVLTGLGTPVADDLVYYLGYDI